MTPVSRQFDEAMDRLRDTSGIVIDLRGNPGGVLTMVMGLSGHFVSEAANLGTITTRDSALNLIANPRLVGASGRPVIPFAGPVAILVDDGSYSASEIFSGGMQAIGRARIFGTQTSGGALPAVLERLPGGDVLQYAIGDFVTATGQRIEGRGVVPDQVVTPAREDLLGWPRSHSRRGTRLDCERISGPMTRSHAVDGLQCPGGRHGWPIGPPGRARRPRRQAPSPAGGGSGPAPGRRGPEEVFAWQSAGNRQSRDAGLGREGHLRDCGTRHEGRPVHQRGGAQHNPRGGDLQGLGELQAGCDGELRW